MRRFLLAAAAAAAVAMPIDAAAAAAVAMPIDQPKFGALDCASCVEIVTALQAVANSTSLQQFVESILDNACQSTFAGQNSTIALCDDLANGLVSLLPWLDKQMETLAWDIPQTFCSVFVPVCTNPCCSSPTAPEQLHLSLTGSDSSVMRITWVTLNNTATSTVRWGLATADPTSLPFSATGNTRTYTFGGWLGVIHIADMTGLLLGQTYTYRVGDASGGWSDAYNFTAFPDNLGTADRPFRIIQIGDMAYDDTSDATVAAMTALVEAGAVDMLMHTGDISYADGEQPHWDMFMRKVQPITARIPQMTTAGNHELWANFTAYKARFSMPNEASTQSMYYDFAAGGVTFIMFNTETAIDTADIDPVEASYIKAALAAVNRTTTPWIVAGGHRPLYCTNSDKVQCGLFPAILRMQIEDAFYTNAVDLVITSHEHSYERTLPLYNSTVMSPGYVNPAAPVYIVNGAAGNREGNDHPTGNQPWSAFQSSTVGYAVIEIAGPSKLTYSFFDSNSTQLLDAFTITRNATTAAL